MASRSTAAWASREVHDEERARVLALLRRHGSNTTSFQVLEEGYQYAFFGDDACVSFVDTGAAWVVAGAPIAATEKLAEVAGAFVDLSRSRGKRACFFATEQRFVERAPTMDSILVGKQPIWDPRLWPETVRSVRSLREQMRRARAKGVVIERIDPANVEPGSRTLEAIRGLIARWRRARSMAPMGFLVQLDLFRFQEERRHYAAWRGESLVGFLGLVPVYGRGGWFFEDLLRDPAAPNGTTELLFDHAMRDLADDGVVFATFGLAPLAGSVGSLLRLARTVGRPLYDFEGLYAFKQKLRPTRWEHVYLSFPRGAPRWLAIADALSAFARRSFVRFGVVTLLRGPDVVVRALTAMLVPWTAMLASIEPARWFPSIAVRNGWVGFDVALTVALVSLVARWRHGLATALALLVSLDACMTLAEALVWNLPRLRSAGDVAAIVIAAAAPTMSAVVLWNARARHALLAGVAELRRAKRWQAGPSPPPT